MNPKFLFKVSVKKSEQENIKSYIVSSTNVEEESAKQKEKQKKKNKKQNR